MKYNIGRITSATKYGALGAGCLGLGTALLVPVLGVLAHIGGGTLTDASLQNYSLKNRFETAYETAFGMYSGWRCDLFRRQCGCDSFTVWHQH